MAIFDLVNLKKALNSAFLNWKTSKNEQNQNSKCLKILKNFEKISKNQTFDLVKFKKCSTFSNSKFRNLYKNCSNIIKS